jgi:hypothetical protein
VSIFDLATLKVLGKITVGEHPDAILYDPASKRVFTFNGRSHDVTAIDAAKGTVIGTIKLNGKPEFSVSDDKEKFSSTWTAASCWRWIRTSSRSSHAGRWLPVRYRRDWPSIARTGACFPAAATRSWPLSMPTGKSSARFRSAVDAAAFDPETALAFASCGEGMLTVLHEDSRRKCPHRTRRAHHGTRPHESSDFPGDCEVRTASRSDR